MADTKPSYVYKILPSSAAPPSPFPESLPVSDLDSESGFIHLSTSKQVPRTLQLFFSQELTVHVLRLTYSVVEKGIIWEDVEGAPGSPGAVGVFPHLYNGNHLGRDEVESVVIIERGREGWEKSESLSCLIQKGWLIE